MLKRRLGRPTTTNLNLGHGSYHTKYIDRQMGAAPAVKRTLHRSAVVKKELSQESKLSIYWPISVPTLTYGHVVWVIRSWIQAQMSLLHRVFGLSLLRLGEKLGQSRAVV